MTLEITFHGQSAFTFKADGQDVLTDPFITGNPLATIEPDSLNPNTILLTHAHEDHVGDTVPIAKRTGAMVVATAELARWLGTQGVENLSPGNFGGTHKFEGGSAKFTQAWHTSSYTLEDGTQVAIGLPAGFVIRFGGKTIYFAGDTSLFSDMKLIGEEGIDIAILPIGDNFTMGPEDAARAAEFVGAKTVIPCHYNTFPRIQQDPEAFKKLVEERMDAEVVIMQPGETREFCS